MTKAEVNEKIRAAAQAHGFESREEANFQGFADIKSEELNFTYQTRTTENTDWDARHVEEEVKITASVRKMGGTPTPEELLKTADEIKRGAELVAELQAMDLTWSEDY